MRNGYEVMHARALGPGRSRRPVGEYWKAVEDDPELAGRWASLEQLPAGLAGPPGLGVLQGPRLQLPRHPDQRVAPVGPARLRPRPVRLRHDGRVRDRGLRPDRPGRRGPAVVQPAGRRPGPVRERLPRAGAGRVPGRPRSPQREAVGHGRPPRATPSPAAARWRGSSTPRTASTSSAVDWFARAERGPGRAARRVRLHRPGSQVARGQGGRVGRALRARWRRPRPRSGGDGTWRRPRVGRTTRSACRCEPDQV